MAHHEQKEEFYNGVSTLNEPSAKWGWHGLSKGAVLRTGWIATIFMLCMIWGNHKGNVENIWLIVLGVVMIIGMLWYTFKPRGTQVRTVTARNKPQDHVEPNWCHDQANGTGAYARLSESQMRAWNRDPNEVAVTSGNAISADGQASLH